MSSIFERMKSFFDGPQPADRIERKMNLLVVFSAIQTMTLLLMAVMMFADSLIPSWTTMFFMVVALGAAAWIFRDSIPGWFAVAFRGGADLINRAKAGRSKAADASRGDGSKKGDRTSNSRTSSPQTADRNFR